MPVEAGGGAPPEPKRAPPRPEPRPAATPPEPKQNRPPPPPVPAPNPGEQVPKSVGEALGAEISAGATPAQAAAETGALAAAQTAQGFGAPAAAALPAAASEVAAATAAQPPPGAMLAPIPPSEQSPALGPPEPPKLLTTTPLNGLDFVNELFTQAGLHDVDPLAAASVALQEGAGGGIGDSGTAYGPWQIHLTDGRLAAFEGIPPNNRRLQEWAWSQAGIVEAFREMVADGAKALTGHGAVHQIVYGFERPANEPREQTDADTEYDNLISYTGDVRVLLAQSFPGVGGPITGTGLPGTPLPAGPPPAPPTPPPGVSQAWNALLTTFDDDTTLEAGTVKRLAAGLSSIFP